MYGIFSNHLTTIMNYAFLNNYVRKNILFILNGVNNICLRNKRIQLNPECATCKNVQDHL